jgi:hypothetical protein
MPDSETTQDSFAGMSIDNEAYQKTIVLSAKKRFSYEEEQENCS